jgi:hypothetical protein
MAAGARLRAGRVIADASNDMRRPVGGQSEYEKGHQHTDWNDEHAGERDQRSRHVGGKSGPLKPLCNSGHDQQMKRHGDDDSNRRARDIGVAREVPAHDRAEVDDGSRNQVAENVDKDVTPKGLGACECRGLGLCLPKTSSTLVRAVPGIMDLDQLGSAVTVLCVADDGCGMMARRVATTGVPRPRAKGGQFSGAVDTPLRSACDARALASLVGADGEPSSLLRELPGLWPRLARAPRRPFRRGSRLGLLRRMPVRGGPRRAGQ